MSHNPDKEFKPDLTAFVERMNERYVENDKKRAAAAELFETRTFLFEPFEQQTLNEWLTEHNKTCSMRWNEDGTPIQFPGGAAGGTLTYKFTPTGIGMALYVECSCKEIVNLTDYDSW